MATAVVDLAVIEPFPWHTLLTYFSSRLIPGVERIEGERFIRRIGKREIAIEFDPARRRLIVTADGRVKSALVAEHAARLFAIDHDASEVARHFRRDPVLQGRLEAVPGMRPLGAWSPFELCVRTIIGQQVTVAAAGTLMRRLVERCTEVTPSSVLEADLANMGMPGKRVETIRNLARATLEERVQFDLPWREIDAALKTLPGFGPWTRTYLAIRLGREPDAFPETDLGLIRAAGAASPAALLQQAEQWRPWRAYAATYLWAVPSRAA
jgi:3-methyladenine DNA glycosylase/8-oxoguanine DNA glycosylase